MDAEDVFITVIIPVYNCMEYIGECINGILSSAVESIEIILIDDGSTDGSSALCDSLEASDSRVRVVHTENRGPSAARNTGIELAKGRYLCFADGDDYIDSSAFAKTVGELRKITPDVLACDFYRVAGNGTVLDRVFQIRDTENPITDNSYRLNFLSARDCIWNVWRYIYCREYIIRSSLRFPEGIDCGEDLLFSVTALMGTDNTAYYHNPYYHYRVNHGTTLMHRLSGKRVSQLVKMLDAVYEKTSLFPSPEAECIAAKISREYILNLTLYAEAPNGEKTEILGIFSDKSHLMKSACGLYVPVAWCVKILGIPFTAHALLLMKKVKRFIRNVKQGKRK